MSAIGYEHFSKNPLITQDFDVIVCKGFLPYNENGKINHFMIGLVPKKQKFDPKNLPKSLIIVDPSLNFVRYNIYDKTLLVPNATEKIELLRTPNGKIITNLPIMGPILGIIGYTKDFLKNYLITDLDDFLFMDFNEMSKSFLFYRINSKNKYKTHVPISALDINVDVLRLLKNKIIESIYFANYNS